MAGDFDGKLAVARSLGCLGVLRPTRLDPGMAFLAKGNGEIEEGVLGRKEAGICGEFPEDLKDNKIQWDSAAWRCWIRRRRCAFWCKFFEC